MNKTELVAAIAEKTGLTKKDAEGAVKAFTDTVAEQLKAGDKIQLVGFGTFEVTERAARTFKGCHLCGSLFSLYLIKFTELRFINYGNRTQISGIRHP